MAFKKCQVDCVLYAFGQLAYTYVTIDVPIMFLELF